MKKFVLIIAVMVAAALTVPQLYNKLNESQDQFSSSDESSTDTVSEECAADVLPAENGLSVEVSAGESDALYIKNYGNFIGIWKNPNEKPYMILEVQTFTLPEADRNLIEKGFCIPADELDSLICDYTG